MFLFKIPGYYVLASEALDKLITRISFIEVIDTILSNMNEDLLTGAVYLDLKKAFDTVNHQTVLKKMLSLGIII